jgi:hypothetical protein
MRLLTVVSQHFLARWAEFITVLLEASQHGKVALIQHRLAERPDVGGTSPLFFGGPAVLRNRGDGQQKQRDSRKGNFSCHRHVRGRCGDGSLDLNDAWQDLFLAGAGCRIFRRSEARADSS